MLSPEIIERNRKISENGKLTREKRKIQECKTFDLKIVQSKLNKTQKEALNRVFLEAKWYMNSIIASDNINKITTKKQSQVPVKLKDGEIEYRDLKHLGSHHQQSLLSQVKENIKSLATQKKNGRKVGKIRFVKRVDSIGLKQHGVTYKFVVKDNITPKNTKNKRVKPSVQAKVRLQGIPGLVNVLGAKQLDGYELSNAKIVRKPSGYHLMVTAFKNKSDIIETYQPDTQVGLDMGVKTHLTLSNGKEFNTIIGETERLKKLQRKLAKQIKGSNNYAKTCHKVKQQYELMDNKKNDAANKIVHELLNYAEVFMQDESISAWRSKKGWVKGGKRLQHSVLGRVKAKLVKHDRVIVLPKWYPTTQLCRGEGCGSLNKHEPGVETYTCSCGYSASRDAHAALNMISLGLDFKYPRFSGTETVKPVEGNKTCLTAGTGLKEHNRNRVNAKKQEADKLLLEDFQTEAA